ncbi:cytochrome c oxidase subunit II [Croceicoccus estronivorus]|uniref:cytochrome c oxidase subunit II n=1 Tax=Croceicoccus estronivorus TaxID=1172626 RepID=UPI0008374C22|nr:cytochrome c oxidase subunit II [Croceicoccus estronivorus]OCC24981.1 cytochrome c oxidase subunit II [Croceicoccus estronivorus]
MNLGELARNRAMALKTGALALALAVMPQAVLAQDAAEAGDAAAAAAPAVEAVARMAPTPGKGMPTDGGIFFQNQYSPIGDYAIWMHDAVLMPVITVITLLVLLLLLFVIVRFNRRSNPTPSKTSHNTLIEVIWTLVPVLILVGIAVPSIDLLAKQYKSPPADALTVKITGNQWFWTYSYPDNGEVEFDSKMLNEPNGPIINAGVRVVGTDPSDGPGQLEVDNRLVLPVGEPIRLQVTASDVIHSFAVPSLWFKLDAVPGRLNEKMLFIKEPGVYYGQCSELCGVKHGYMPIAVEALPRKEFDAWLLSQGGTLAKADAKAKTEPAAAGDEAAEAAPAEQAEQEAAAPAA